jgi:hypothetical protein
MQAREWRALALRLGSARDADRALDRAIALAFGQLHIDEDYEGRGPRLYRIDPDGSHCYGGFGDDILIQDYTGSIDDAVGLAKEVLGELTRGWSLRLDLVIDDLTVAELQIGGEAYVSHGFNAPLAVCICLAKWRAGERDR